MGNKTFVSVLVFISSVCVYIRVKPIITARIVTICWAVSQSVYDGRELNAAVLTSMVRAVWVSFCFDFKCWDKGTSFTMHHVCSVLLNVVLRLHDFQYDLHGAICQFCRNLHTHRISVETQLS